jgi:DNA-binding NtrC family response regulator
MLSHEGMIDIPRHSTGRLDNDPCDSLLITEDEDVIARTQRILEPGGYRLTVLHEGRQGLEALRDGAFPICLVDQDLVDVSGFEVVGQGKDISPNTEFIMLFAYPNVERALLSLTYGAYGYLEKPLDDAGALLTKVILARERVALSRELDRLRTAARAEPRGIPVTDDPENPDSRKET